MPLQDPDAACAELDRCLAAGHAGVEIGNHVGDRDLDDAGIVTFLQHCASRRARRCSCTRGTCRPAPRLDRWMARWLAGMPAETHLSILALILGGVFDRVAGDAAALLRARRRLASPFWLGRVDNAWHRRPRRGPGPFAVPAVATTSTGSIVDPWSSTIAPLRLLVDTLGADQVMLGSDYPYPLGERPVGAVVRRADFLDGAARDKLRSANPLRFLGRSA